MIDLVLQFTAVGHYDFHDDRGPCVPTVVAAFARREDAEKFIREVNDEQQAEELELFINGQAAR